MKRIIAVVIFVTCGFAMVGWSSTYNGKSDRDNGYEQADRKRQGNDEDIKRAQGEESAMEFIHDNKSHQDE